MANTARAHFDEDLTRAEETLLSSGISLCAGFAALSLPISVVGAIDDIIYPAVRFVVHGFLGFGILSIVVVSTRFTMD